MVCLSGNGAATSGDYSNGSSGNASTTVAEFFARVNAGADCSGAITVSNGGSGGGVTVSQMALDAPSNFEIIQKYVAEPAITASDRQRFAEWMRGHFGATCLYPSRQDKERIGRDLGISFSQVNRLLANYRRRQLKYGKIAKKGGQKSATSPIGFDEDEDGEAARQNVVALKLLREEHDSANISNHSNKENGASTSNSPAESNFAALLNPPPQPAGAKPALTAAMAGGGSKPGYHRRYVQQGQEVAQTHQSSAGGQTTRKRDTAEPSNMLTKRQTVAESGFLAGREKEPFATPPPSQPPASLLLSPTSASGLVLTTAAGGGAHFVYPAGISPLYGSSLLMTPPELAAGAGKCDDGATKPPPPGTAVDVDELKRQLQSHAILTVGDQPAPNIAVVLTALIKQQQDEQLRQAQLDACSKASQPSATEIVASAASTETNAYPTGTTLALNQLIDNVAVQSPQSRYEPLQPATVAQPQPLANLSNSEQPAADDSSLPVAALLALLQQQNQQQSAAQLRPDVILQLSVLRELQLLQQRQQLEALIASAIQQQHQQQLQQQAQQQQQGQMVSPELLQSAQLLVHNSGLPLNADTLMAAIVEQQKQQQQQAQQLVRQQVQHHQQQQQTAATYLAAVGNGAVNFLSPPLTHTPMSIADELSSSSPFSSLSLLSVSANASRSSPVLASGRRPPLSQMQTQPAQPDRSLDAFERAIARRHGDLTDRESLAVAVLASELAAARE